jgi:transmembrane sensor
MTSLPHPLRRALREPFTDASLAPLWPAIEHRRRALRSHGRAWGALGVMGAVGTAVAVLALRASPPAGPLRLHGGGVVPSVSAGVAGRVLVLDDRSRVSLSADARWHPTDNSGTVFASILEAGRVRFDVTPHGPRRWTVAGGLATVTVTGTSFVLTRSPEGLSVQVLEGRVQVSGPTLPHGAVALGAGETLAVRPTTASIAALQTLTPSVDVTQHTTPQAILQATPQATIVAPAPALRSTRREGAALSAEALLAQAEDARGGRRFALAAERYQAFLAQHPTHPQAAVVAFTLGRLQAEQLGDPGAAARSFGRALDRGVPRSLEEDVWARRVEALARAGDRAGARRAAEAYLARVPQGRRAGDVRRWGD